MLLMKTHGKVLKLWVLFLLSKIRASNLWKSGEKVDLKKKKSLSPLKQSTIFHYSEKLKWILVSSCMRSYHFRNKVDPQNTSAKGNVFGNSWAYGKGRKRWGEKNSSYKWKKESKSTFLWKAAYSASFMKVKVTFLYTIISFSSTTALA